MEPKITKQSHVTVVSLGPDFENISQFDEQAMSSLNGVFSSIARTADPPLVVIDLPHTKYFSSAFIGALLGLWHELNTRDGARLDLSSLTPTCAEIIQVSQLHRTWNLFDTPNDAIREMLSARDHT